MSAEPNTKHVTVAHPVPRDPEEYRATIHFQQRLKERVPEHDHSTVVRRCIETGECRGASPPQDVAHDDVRQFFAFEQRVGETDYRVIVGVRDEAFLEDAQKHYAVTIMEVVGDE